MIAGNDSGLPDPSSQDAAASPTDAPPADLPDVDHMTLAEFVRSFAFRLLGLWMFTTSLLITTLAILQVPIWKGAVAALVLSLGTVGKKLGYSIARCGHLSRQSLSVAMAEAPDDLQANYAIQNQYNYSQFADQPKS